VALAAPPRTSERPSAKAANALCAAIAMSTRDASPTLSSTPSATPSMIECSESRIVSMYVCSVDETDERAALGRAVDVTAGAAATAMVDGEQTVQRASGRRDC
jgi:hypothetical protein